MCGRFTLTLSAEAIKSYFDITDGLILQPHYNIAPSANVLVVRQLERHPREFAFMRWALVPSWLNETDITSHWINARAETIEEKPLFRQAFHQRRCLIVADGFFEWKLQGKIKQPIYIRKLDHSPIAFAGIWEHWQNKDGKTIESCAIITTVANALLKPIHGRMPVMLDQKDFALWLDNQNANPHDIKILLKPFSAKSLERYPVSLQVNKPSYDSKDCIKPLDKNKKTS